MSLYRFGEPSSDEFFTSDFMQDYSEAVFIEGDRPIDYVDVSVFVARTPPKRRSLLRRVIRDHAAAHRKVIEQLAQALENPDAVVSLLGAGLGSSLSGVRSGSSGGVISGAMSSKRCSSISG